MKPYILLFLVIFSQICVSFFYHLTGNVLPILFFPGHFCHFFVHFLLISTIVFSRSACYNHFQFQLVLIHLQSESLINSQFKSISDKFRQTNSVSFVIDAHCSKGVKSMKRKNKKIQKSIKKRTQAMKHTLQQPSLTPPVNRLYKDRLFHMLFSDKTALLSLYNALNGTHYDNPDDLIITIYMGMHNDVSCILFLQSWS